MKTTPSDVAPAYDRGTPYGVYLTYGNTRKFYTFQRALQQKLTKGQRNFVNELKNQWLYLP